MSRPILKIFHEIYREIFRAISQAIKNREILQLAMGTACRIIVYT